MTQRNRPAKTITLAADLVEKITDEAEQGHVTASQVIEAHLREHYQGGVVQRLEHLENLINDLRAQVLPVVVKVAGLIQQLEQDGQGLSSNAENRQALHIVSQEEMYGPITPAVPPTPPEPVVEQKSWWRRS
jgi:hypothetical protein